MTNAHIEIKNLTKRFGHFTALSNLNLSVDSNRIFGLLGLNGAGKSTTMRCMLTLIQPDAGEILYNGLPLIQNRKSILKQVGSLVEKADHYLYLTAYENLVMHSKLYGISPDKKYLMQLIDLVGLHAQAELRVKTFSQGMKQRLGIAATLVHQPELIILDEPMNGLDPQGIIDLRNLILRLKNEMQKTVIVSSHLLNEIEQIADDFAIIHHGQTMIQGTVREMVSNNEMLVSITCNDSERFNRAMQLTTYSKQIQHFDQEGIQLKLNQNEIQEVLKLAVENGISIYSIQSKNRLEDYFFKLTQHE